MGIAVKTKKIQTTMELEMPVIQTMTMTAYRMHRTIAARPQTQNQDDTDGDGLGDDCNDAFDTDGDEWEDSIDNCPEFNNPTQTDDDNNGIGDNCEFDLTIQRVEITQGIQDHNNSVPLISGKHIWVRVYLDVGTAGFELGPVRGWFRFKDEHGLPNPPFINGAYQPPPRPIAILRKFYYGPPQSPIRLSSVIQLILLFRRAGVGLIHPIWN